MWAFVLTILVVAVLVGLGVWLAVGRQPQAPTPIPLGSAVTTTPVAAATTATVVPTSTAAATSTADDAKLSKKATPATKVRQLTLITGITGSAGSGYTVKLDYMSDLSGTKAGEAYAKAHGDEWPPPNDYYYVNQSKKIRTFKVAASTPVYLTGSDSPTLMKASMALLKKLLAGDRSGDKYWNSGIYWATIVGGTKVTKITAQWLP